MMTGSSVFDWAVPILLYYAVSLPVSMILAMLTREPWLDDASMIVTGAVLIPLFLYMIRQDERKEQAVKEARWLTVLSVPAGMFLSWAAGHLMEVSGIYRHFSNQVQENMLSAPLWLQFLALVVISPVMEELLYRGLVYRRLSRHIPWWAAMLISTGCFALGHGNVIQILYAFPLSLLLTLDYRYAGTLAAPILMHMGANLLTVVLTMI